MMSKKFFTVILAVLMLSMSVGGFTFAKEAEGYISVFVTVQKDGEFMLPKTEILLPADYADGYGFDGVGEYAAIDALTAANDAIFGEDFTQETASDYICMNNGMLTKAFGASSSAFGFCINGGQPNDGVLVESPYGDYYTGYTIENAPLSDGDFAEFYFYSDTDYYLDSYCFFEKDGVRADALTVAEGDTVCLTLSGFTVAWYGCYPNPESYCESVPETVVYVDSNDGNGLVPIDATDDDGKVSLTFDSKGRYVVSALHDTTDEYATPVIMPYLVINVGDAENSETPFTPKSVLPKPDEGELLCCFEIPADTTLFVGKKTAHFTDFKELLPDCTVGNRYWFSLADKGVFNYRVTKKDCVPIAGKFTVKQGETKLTFTDENFTDDTKAIIRNDGYYNADILFNLNRQNSLGMKVGESFELVPMRVWQTVDTTSGNYFFEPDFTYSVYGDSISVAEDGTVTAITDGTSFVTVTYDAIAANGHLYSAIFPENTGVFAVTVGDGYSESPLDIDSELDPLFYLENDGAAKYTFTLPEEWSNAEVTLLSSKITETSADYGNFVFTSDTVSSDGNSVTLTLPEGRSIVRFSKNGKTAYHVITAKPITLSVESSDGDEEDIIKEGDKLRVTLEGLCAPVPKLAGVYNVGSKICYTDENANIVNGKSGQYNFMLSANYIELTIPEGAFDDGAYRLDKGSIYVSGWGDPIGSGHRSITRENGKNPNFAAERREAYVAQLPAIVITPDGVKAETPKESLSVKHMPTKTSYYVGDAFFSEGLVLSYTDKNGVIHEITEGFEVSPSSSLLRSNKSVTVSYGGLSASVPVTVSAKPQASTNKISVYVAVRGDILHGDDAHEGSYPVWIKSTKVKLDKGMSAFDAIYKVLAENGYAQVGGGDGYISEVTTPDGETIGEFDNGKASGWMYTVNNKLPEVGMLDYVLKSGDKIALFFTDDFNELWTGAWSGASGTIVVNVTGDGKTVGEATSDSDKKDDSEEKEEKDERGKNEENEKADVKTDENSDLKETTDSASVNEDGENAGTVAEKKGILPFKDTESTAWYYTYVSGMFEKGYINGRSEDKFAPNDGVTRGELAKLLFAISGDSVPNMEILPFEDVKENDFFHGSVLWAYREGIVNGVSEKSFAPTERVTREDAAVMLWRYLESQTAEEYILSFDDAEEISDYAREAVKLICSLGIMNGDANGNFAPQRQVTRAEICKMLLVTVTLSSAN